MRMILTAAALTAAAVASAAGPATAAPLPTGPNALKKVTGLILPAPDNTTGSSVDNAEALLSLRDTNAVNVMSDHSRTQVTGTSGVQG
jgi:hypothetical protein